MFYTLSLHFKARLAAVAAPAGILWLCRARRSSFIDRCHCPSTSLRLLSHISPFKRNKLIQLVKKKKCVQGESGMSFFVFPLAIFHQAAISSNSKSSPDWAPVVCISMVLKTDALSWAPIWNHLLCQELWACLSMVGLNACQTERCLAVAKWKNIKIPVNGYKSFWDSLFFLPYFSVKCPQVSGSLPWFHLDMMQIKSSGWDGCLAKTSSTFCIFCKVFFLPWWTLMLN